ncbi:hypothetical protein GUJ93_ZPchr0009g677 [Zizania palustris]|uniref:Uncharacterized protein n=1 Tax=Zizania palustris TaxID=103762 RepID=A0A8J5S341_ZIZPA|nr:hypothetical protein GUJ93_ZPchr0009g677 [Zizania palustris]
MQISRWGYRGCGIFPGAGLGTRRRRAVERAAAVRGRARERAGDFLRRHVGDHPRAFFADVLPSLLFRVFVASPTSPSFIDLAAGDSALAELLTSLLSPSGPLLAAVSAADRHALLRFVFPPERLPDWLRLALSSSSSDVVISPLLAGRVGSELHLSVFEYYIFWFAYYPISAVHFTVSNYAFQLYVFLEKL